VGITSFVIDINAGIDTLRVRFIAAEVHGAHWEGRELTQIADGRWVQPTVCFQYRGRTAEEVLLQAFSAVAARHQWFPHEASMARPLPPAVHPSLQGAFGGETHTQPRFSSRTDRAQCAGAPG